MANNLQGFIPVTGRLVKVTGDSIITDTSAIEHHDETLNVTIERLESGHETIKDENERLNSVKADKSDLADVLESLSSLTLEAGSIRTDLSDCKNEVSRIDSVKVSHSDLDVIDEKINNAKALIEGKQNALQSGINIKTINNESILGSGNIELPTKAEFNEASRTTTESLNNINERLNNIPELDDLQEIQTIIEDLKAISSDLDLAATVARHEKEIYEGDATGGEDTPDPIIPDDPTPEEPEPDIPTEDDVTLEAAPIMWAGQNSYSLFWSSQIPAKLLSTPGAHVSVPILLHAGDTITYELKVWGTNYTPIVAFYELPSVWAISGDTQTTADFNIKMLEGAGVGNTLTGIWQNDKGRDVYVSVSYAEGDYTTSDFKVKITRVTSTASVHSTVSTYAIDETQLENSESSTEDAPIKVSRITKLENTTKNFSNKLSAIETKVDNLSNSDDITVSPMTGYGYYGNNYPNEVLKVVDLHSNPLAHCSFIHISDTHNTYNGLADADIITDKIGADFLVHTGDILDNITMDASSFITKINAMEKPCYLVSGNHDYSQPKGSEVTVDRDAFYNKYIATTNEHNGMTTDKTYYSHVYNKVRCIFLDQYETYNKTTSETEQAMATYVAMSKEQVEWFIAELTNAKTNGEVVAIFLHTPFPSQSNLVIRHFDECANTVGRSNGNSGYPFLLSLVDAFIDGKPYNITYDGNTYSGTFPNSRELSGMFAGWFTGHEHQDTVGRVLGHEKQMQISIISVLSSAQAHSTVKNHNGKVCNFVMITPAARTVTIYRLGEQETYGEKRDICSYTF